LAKRAILLEEDRPGGKSVQLARTLDFFGVPWKTLTVSELTDIGADAQEQVVFALARTAASAIKQTQRANRPVPRPAAVYVYTDNDLDASERGLHSLCGNGDFLLRRAPEGVLSLRVSSELADVAGPMAGVEVSSRLRREDNVLVGPVDDESGFTTVISAGDAPVFVRFHQSGIPIFFCASSYVLDIDETVGPGYYDVKDHFCSVVPLVMFIRLVFPDVAWQPQELGACLIIDDPLLRRRYGACNFEILRNLMQQYGFTTDIAFIPWNWRRTSRPASKFFRNESGHFSVSIHGCDHARAEFGEASQIILSNKAKLAQSRMRNHELRTGIHHDPVMIFPQGIFSSTCPEVLKFNGFLAAVNTETMPADSGRARTRIKDVWDVAIMRYGCFPIFTRRYAHHGLENFAFDLLLGKPCLIVSHHDFFQDGCTELIELIENLRSLNCCLYWRSLGDVIRRSCRRRFGEQGVEEVEMYSNELLINNPTEQMIKVHVQKREYEADVIDGILCNQKPLMWTSNDDHLVFDERVEARSEGHFQVLYRGRGETEKVVRSWSFELSVAVRRILSEVRDEHVYRSRSIRIKAANLTNMLTRTH
jgi:hypothetical protein